MKSDWAMKQKPEDSSTADHIAQLERALEAALDRNGFYLDRIAELKAAIVALLEATPQEQCGEDCDIECCPWMQAREALEP
jgi:hypothetical protein